MNLRALTHGLLTASCVQSPRKQHWTDIISVRWKNLDRYPDEKQTLVLDVSGQLVFKGNSPEGEGNRVGLFLCHLEYVTLGKKVTPAL